MHDFIAGGEQSNQASSARERREGDEGRACRSASGDRRADPKVD